MYAQYTALFRLLAPCPRTKLPISGWTPTEEELASIMLSMYLKSMIPVNELFCALMGVLKRNIPCLFLILFAFILATLLKQPAWTLPFLVDWKTIVTLSGMLILTTAIKESGFFSFIAYRIALSIGNERVMALFLLLLAAFLSMFLTNDVALFIVVPLTLNLQSILERDYTRIIIFEALAVNAGSALTPIGNPQNIFLWHQWGIRFHNFVGAMAPIVLIMGGLLVAMALLFFPSRKIIVLNNQKLPVNRRLFWVSILALMAFITSVEFGHGFSCLLFIFLVAITFKKEIIHRTDWGLVVLFIVIFIDIQMLCFLEPVKALFSTMDFKNTQVLFFSGAFVSQIVSNVPAAILLANHSCNFKIIAYGVNIGGNGLILGSFANLIALRFIDNKSAYLTFHLYSVPYFFITLYVCWFLLF